MFSRKIVLECVTYEPYVHEFAQIQKASEFIPEWYSKMKGRYDSEVFTASTIKKCPALQNAMTKGFILPMWTDLAIKMTEHDDGWGYEYQFADGKTENHDHDSRQWEGKWNPKTHAHMKWVSPWYFNCSHDIQWLWQKPYYHDTNDDVDIIQGIVEFKHQSTSNINCMVKGKDKVFVKHGTPLVQLIPLTDKEVHIKHTLVNSKEEWERHNKMPIFTFQNNYKTVVKKRCPFHK